MFIPQQFLMIVVCTRTAAFALLYFKIAAVAYCTHACINLVVLMALTAPLGVLRTTEPPIIIITHMA